MINKAFYRTNVRWGWFLVNPLKEWPWIGYFGPGDALSSGTVNSWMVSVWACQREGVALPSHPQVARWVFQKVFSFKDPPSKYMTKEKIDFDNETD